MPWHIKDQAAHLESTFDHIMSLESFWPSMQHVNVAKGFLKRKLNHGGIMVEKKHLIYFRKVSEKGYNPLSLKQWLLTKSFCFPFVEHK